MITLKLNLAPDEDIWLHKYSNIKRLDNWLIDGKAKMPLSRIDQFKDPKEGWHILPLDVLETLSHLEKYITRVKEVNGTIENIWAVFQGFLKLHFVKIGSKVEMPVRNSVKSKPELLNILKTYYRTITETHCACFFWTPKFETESRYMWNLYTSFEEGMIVSIYWPDLYEALKSSCYSFEAGKVLYNLNTTKRPDLFFKDPSYSHENELRIITNDLDDNKLFHKVGLDKSVKLHCTIHANNKDALEKLEATGFNRREDAFHKYSYSTLYNERHAYDVESFIKLLTT